jgi:uncharacterized protein
MRQILLAFALVSVIAVQAQYTVETIPNTKLTTGSYVSNPDNVISEITITKIDSILIQLEKQTTVQVAVVAVNSIGDNDLFEFAQALFNKWGLGNKSNDNGLLILLAKDDHQIRIHTGDGLEGTLPDATCKKIERDFMLPEFKNGNYDNGMLAGITAVNRILTDARYAEELNATESNENVIGDYTAFIIFLLIFVAPVILVMFFVKKSNGSFSDTKNHSKSIYNEMAMTKWNWLVMAVLFPTLIVLYFGVINASESIFLAMVSLYFYAMATLFYRQWRMKKVINRFKSAGNY